jgi:hypothetical protein
MTADQETMRRAMVAAQQRFALFKQADSGRQITTNDQKTAERTQIGQKPANTTGIGERPANYTPIGGTPPAAPNKKGNGNTYKSQPNKKNGALTSAREFNLPDLFPNQNFGGKIGPMRVVPMSFAGGGVTPITNTRSWASVGFYQKDGPIG